MGNIQIDKVQDTTASYQVKSIHFYFLLPEDRHEEANKGWVRSCDVLKNYHQANQGRLGVCEAKCLKERVHLSVCVTFFCFPLKIFPGFKLEWQISPLPLGPLPKICLLSLLLLSVFISVPLSLFQNLSLYFTITTINIPFTDSSDRIWWRSNLIEGTRFAEIAKQGKKGEDLNLKYFEIF